MRKLLLIFSLFFFIKAIGQNPSGPTPPLPNWNWIGSPTTLSETKGVHRFTYGHILSRWADTTTANANAYIKSYAGLMIIVGDTVFVRNSTATAWITISGGGGGGGGSGTLTNFTAGNLSPLFITNVANSTTTPALTFALATQSANTVFAGPTTGGAATPTFRSLVAADISGLVTASQGVTISGLDVQLFGPLATPALLSTERSINLGRKILHFNNSENQTTSGGPIWQFSDRPFSPYQLISTDTVAANSIDPPTAATPLSGLFARRTMFYNSGIFTTQKIYGHYLGMTYNWLDSMRHRTEGGDYNQAVIAELRYLPRGIGPQKVGINGTNNNNLPYYGQAALVSNTILSNSGGLGDGSTSSIHLWGWRVGVSSYLVAGALDTVERFSFFQTNNFLQSTTRVKKFYGIDFQHNLNTANADSSYGVWDQYGYRHRFRGKTVFGTSEGTVHNWSSSDQVKIIGNLNITDSFHLGKASLIGDTTGFDFNIRRRTDGAIFRMRADQLASVLGVGGGGSGLDNVLSIGQALTTNRDVPTSAFYLTITSSTSSAGTFKAVNTADAPAINGTNTGTGYGVYGSSVTTHGGGFYSENDAGLLGGRMNATTNTVLPVFEVDRWTTGTAATGIGAAIDMKVETTDGTAYMSNQIISVLTNATTATRSSELNITGINSAVTETFANFQTGGIVRVNNLADTLATRAYARSVGGGGGGSSIYTTDAAFTSNRTADLDGKTIDFDENGLSFLHIDPTLDGETVWIGARNPTLDDNYGIFQGLTTSGQGAFELRSAYDNTEYAYILGASASGPFGEIEYYAQNQHTFSGGNVGVGNTPDGNHKFGVYYGTDTLFSIGHAWGQVMIRAKQGATESTIFMESFPAALITLTGGVRLADFAGNGVGTIGVDNDGDLSFLDPVIFSATYFSGAGTVGSPIVPIIDASPINGSLVPTTSDAVFDGLALKAPLASPTFTGTVTIPTPFTLGATSVTTTGTQLNYLNAATGTTGTTSSNIVFSTSPTFTTSILLAGSTSGNVTLASSSLSGTLVGTNLSGTGNVPIVHRIYVRSDETLANSNADQNLFTNTAHDVITVQANTTYEFFMSCDKTSSAVSHSISLGFLPTTAVVTNIEYTGFQWITAVGTQTASQTSFKTKSTATTAINAAGANAANSWILWGTITIGATGGTITPQIKFSADPTGTILLKAGSTFKIWAVGNDTFTEQGPFN